MDATGQAVSISALSDRGLLLWRRALAPTDQRCALFQYPLFRIVDCFGSASKPMSLPSAVSISALSDRGLLHNAGKMVFNVMDCFNIRSFGSWIASANLSTIASMRSSFQYPLFRIVDCFELWQAGYAASWLSFNIRSFGSWIASLAANTKRVFYPGVSISALSDRGLLPHPLQG